MTKNQNSTWFDASFCIFLHVKRFEILSKTAQIPSLCQSRALWLVSILIWIDLFALTQRWKLNSKVYVSLPISQLQWIWNPWLSALISLCFMLFTFKLSMNFLVMGNWRARTLGHIGASLAREVICHAIYLGTVEIGTENNIYIFDSKLFSFFYVMVHLFLSFPSFLAWSGAEIKCTLHHTDQF